MDTTNEMELVTKFTCPLCDEEFHHEEQQLLREHMKAVHLEQMIAYHRQPNRQGPRKIAICFALGCNETSENEDLSFFYLPRRPRGLVWLINAGRYDMLSTPVEHYVNHKLCSKHFEMGVCINRFTSQVSTKALPTIFTHSLEIMTEFPTSAGAEVPPESVKPQYSNSLTEQFCNTVVLERGSKYKVFSISVIPVDEHYDHYEISCRPATKVFRAGDKALIYKLLQGQDVYKASERISKTGLKSKFRTSINNREIKMANHSVTEFHEKNGGYEPYHIYSLEDIDPLLHQDDCSPILRLTGEIVNNNKESAVPEMPTDGAVSVSNKDTSNISEDVGLVQEHFLEHDYSRVHLCSMSNLCRLCANELQNPDEKSLSDALTSLHPLFQKCLCLSQDFKQIDSLPEKVCSLCVEKLQMCDLLFQQIAEANDKLHAYQSQMQKNAALTNTSKVDKAEADEQMKEDHHTSLIDAELTSNTIAMERPSEETCEHYVCEECPESRVYQTLMDLQCHKALVHEADTSNSTGQRDAYTCKYCKRKFGYLKDYYHHPCKKKKRRNSPEHPPVQRILRTVYTRRYKRHAEGFMCCTCGHVAPSEDVIKTHWKSHIPSLPPPSQKRPCRKKEPIFECHICGRKFTEEKYLTKHIEMHPNWRCKTCSKLFKSYLCLYTHKRTHEPDFTRLCHLCGKMYANILQHMKYLHNGAPRPKRTFICHICGKILTHSRCLKRHIYRVHERVNKNIPCPHCKRKYSDELALNKHIDKMHTTPSHFKCELCSKVYKIQAYLRHHVEKQHPACKICQQRFHTEAAKIKHEVLEHNKGSAFKETFDIEDSIQELEVLQEKTLYSFEDLQILGANVQVIMATGDGLLPRNWL